MGDRAKESTWELRVRFQTGQSPGGQEKGKRMRVKLPEGRVQRWVRGVSTLDQDKERKVQGQCPERPQVAVREPCPEGHALTWGPFLCRHLPEQRGALAL